jgi:hypothetical protein
MAISQKRKAINSADICNLQLDLELQSYIFQMGFSWLNENMWDYLSLCLVEFMTE